MTSLVISIVAAFISAVSLGISYLSYQRDRPRVIVTIRRERHDTDEKALYLLHIRLVNSGAHAVQIDTRRFETVGRPGVEWGLSQNEFAGPALPVSLIGYSSIDWWVDIRNIIPSLSGKEDRIRARIALGSGKIVRSSWMTPAISDNAEVQGVLDRQLSLPAESAQPPTVIWR
jgi:hypothetical protein